MGLINHALCSISSPAIASLFLIFFITKDLLGIAKYINIQPVIHIFEKNAYWKLWRGKKLSMRHESFDPINMKNGDLIHFRNLDGQTLPHPTV